MSRVRTDCLPTVIGELTQLAHLFAQSSDPLGQAAAQIVMERARVIACGANMAIAEPEALAFLRSMDPVITAEHAKKDD